MTSAIVAMLSTARAIAKQANPASTRCIPGEVRTIYVGGFEAFQRVWGDRTTPPPRITGAFVSALAHRDFLAEMEAIAIVPE